MVQARMDRDLNPKDSEPEDRWMYTREPVTEEEKKKLLAKMLEMEIKTMFSYHI